MPPSSSLLNSGPLHYESVEAPRQFTATAQGLRVARYLGTILTPISATILTKNSAAHLAEVLTSLQWCDEVVVLDTGSTDETMAIAQQHSNVQLYQLEGAFPGFGRAHQQAVALARHDWIFSVDSDEMVSPGLAAEIAVLPLDRRIVYAMPFHNYFNGRRITSCGWHPDRHARLFNRRTTNFCGSEVHERVQTSNLFVRQLRHPIQHFSYDTMDDFLRKMRSYSQLFAEQNAGRKSSGTGKAVSRSAWAFLKSYFLQRGCLQGREGLVISAYKAQTVFWKYLLLAEANGRRRA
jgi:glycosyltransferase involved in cell wall biosynthesis